MKGYDRYPAKKIGNTKGSVFKGETSILERLRSDLYGESRTLVLETYPGVSQGEIIKLVRSLSPDLSVSASDMLKGPEEMGPLLEEILTDDRVFARMYRGELSDFADPERKKALEEKIRSSRGRTVVWGFGASLLCADLLREKRGDGKIKAFLVYCDITRWEIQLRLRSGMSNALSDNPDEDILKKYKQGYFLEWRLADRIKEKCLKEMDFYLDCSRDGDFVMITAGLFDRLLDQEVSGPFRLVPYFDPGVWGGQWMKKVCGLDPSAPNYAWSFDGVPEENSLLFDLEGTMLEMPAMNLTLMRPGKLLGKRVFDIYGAEFPIRFDFLDTMGGQNLSLQVHPTREYIASEFGMAYTQDESYYILDAGEGACVYLGLKEDAGGEEMFRALRRAQAGEEAFDAEKFINKIPASKHDHFLIPAGTVHCSGKNAMVLEISATPFIFTFKLWDWGRLGLDGKPRPINIGRGEKVLKERRTAWVMENLVNSTEVIRQEVGFTEEHTGLHPLEPIETRRWSIEEGESVRVSCHGSVNMLNLVEGKVCLIESRDGSFPPFEVHYAETFIVPACAGEYCLRAVGGPVRVMQAFVR
ncbi:MAG: class I mannose-6-phosphate isomerase [Lachnospiraceae bacterium]|nr:class I mannose-6-phosphate isomerase [Lachnospiraceae bacterium]